MNIRLCNNDDSGKENNHYWDANTGRAVDAPKVLVFTPEEICPHHRFVSYQEVALAKFALVDAKTKFQTLLAAYRRQHYYGAVVLKEKAPR